MLTRLRDVPYYTLSPAQSSFTVFYDLRDVIGKEELGADFREECKQTWRLKQCVWYWLCRVWKNQHFLCSTSRHQQHLSSLSLPCLCYWSTPWTRHIFVSMRPRCSIGCRPLWSSTREKIVGSGRYCVVWSKNNCLRGCDMIFTMRQYKFVYRQ